MFSTPAVALYALLANGLLATCQFSPAESLAAQFSLTTSTSLPFPTQTLSTNDAQSYLTSNWGLSKGRVQNNPDDLAFIADPFPTKPAPGSTTSSGNGSVLAVTYAADAFASTNSGSQFYSLLNTTDGSKFNSMLLTYEVAFDADFPFVKGGKLPGLRGGPQIDGCSGGDAANGTNCFSTRLMWRKSGQGEVYAYIPSSSSLCKDSNVLCNQDGFGTSIDRGSFSFVPGQWNRVTLLVQLNDASGSANGQVQLYYNNVLALKQQDLVYRTTSDVDIGGLYFSTFFGGDDSSWAPSQTTHSYFRNFQFYGSSASSNLTSTSAATSAISSISMERLFSVFIAVGAVLLAGEFF
ncbi:hypothetical protein ABKN59_003937 [Abortiporus biennis]